MLPCSKVFCSLIWWNLVSFFLYRLHVLHWQHWQHTDQSISEDLLNRVRTRLLTEEVFTMGLETFWAVVENTEADKLCLLVKDLKQLLWYWIYYVCTFSIALNSSTNLLCTSSLRLAMTEISAKRPLVVELLKCSDENTWHITHRCQLIDGLPLSAV